MSEPFPPQPVDLLVVGGGLLGTAVARDAAGRGLAVVLVERDDLAAGASAATLGLVDGGLDALEARDPRRLREARDERDQLIHAAPHLVHRLVCVTPLRAGLGAALAGWLAARRYDRAARPGTTPSSVARLPGQPLGRGLRADVRRGLLTAEAWADDARLVVLAARDAAARGATIRPRTALATARRRGELWEAELRPAGSPAAGPSALLARTLVLAAGAATSEVVARCGDPPPAGQILRDLQVLVPRLHDGDHALRLPVDDGPPLVVLPFEQHFSLIGRAGLQDVGEAEPGEAEVAALLALAARWLAAPPGLEAVRQRRSARRFLLAAPGAVAASGSPPLVVVGSPGRIGVRALAERVVNDVGAALPRSDAPWTAGAPLPGGDIPGGDLRAFHRALGLEYPKLRAGTVATLLRRHGSLAREVLGAAVRPADLGTDFGAGLCEREVQHFVRHEWARELDDVLWRRTRLGLHLDHEQQAAVAACVERCVAELPAS